MTEHDWRKYQPVEGEEDAWREFARPGQQVPLMWEDGVTMLEIVSVAEDGTIEVRSAKPESS
jgi:hypothetical protein